MKTQKNEPSTGFYSKLISNFDQELTVREDNLESVQGILSSLKFEVLKFGPTKMVNTMKFGVMKT